MSERPYTMVLMAVFGILSAFIYAREPNPPMSPDVQVAQSSALPTMVMPRGGNFPAVAQAPISGGTAVMPRGYVPPATQPTPVMTAVPMSSGQFPPIQRTGQPIAPFTRSN